MDSCIFLEVYNNKDIHYIQVPNVIDQEFYISNYYYLPKWVVDHEKLTLFHAIQKINYRMKQKGLEGLPARSENTRLLENLKPKELKLIPLLKM